MLFLPVVVVVGALLGPAGGLTVGGAAAVGIYASAALSHSLGGDAIGQLVVVLPACPTLGWWAGSLASTSAKAAATARRRQEEMQRDISTLSDLLGQVADGDLTAVPFLENAADQATATSRCRLRRHRAVAAPPGASAWAAWPTSSPTASSELVATVAHHVAAVEQQASSVS